MTLQTDAASFCGPVFVIGLPRSGTKLLRNLINRHPRISINEVETEFLPWLVRHAADYADLSRPENFGRLYERMIRFPYFVYRRDQNALIAASQWHAACTTYDPAGIFEALVRLDTGTLCDQSIIWGDKSPSYVDDLDLIAAIYPQARFIHIVRDVRDQCLSIKKAWGKDMLRAAQRWRDGVSAVAGVRPKLADRMLEICYEQLLGDTAAVMQRVCAHLGVAFTSTVTVLDKPSENIGEAKGLNTVMRGNTGKFATRIPVRTVRRIEALTAPLLEQYGYELTCVQQEPRRLGALEMQLRQIKDGANLLRSEWRARGLIGALRFHLSYFLATRG